MHDPCVTKNCEPGWKLTRGHFDVELRPQSVEKWPTSVHNSTANKLKTNKLKSITSIYLAFFFHIYAIYLHVLAVGCKQWSNSMINFRICILNLQICINYFIRSTIYSHITAVFVVYMFQRYCFKMNIAIC